MCVLQVCPPPLLAIIYSMIRPLFTGWFLMYPMKYFLLICLFLPSLGSFADIYKWTDENGRVHYSDKPSTDRKVEKLDIKINSYKHVTYKSLSGAHSNSDKVTMYSTSWCVYCKKARKYFRKNSIPFSEYDIEKNNRAKRAYDALGGKGVPVIIVGKKRMNGFSIPGFERIYP